MIVAVKPNAVLVCVNAMKAIGLCTVQTNPMMLIGVLALKVQFIIVPRQLWLAWLSKRNKCMLVRSGLFIFALLLTSGAQAADLNSEVARAEHRALFNYQMFCQGCHAADGTGHKSVPELKNFMHKFMASQQGREYLVQVPGAANSVLDDEQLTEVMNWMLRNFTDSSNAPTWKPYEVHEISEYRQSPLYETVEYRRNLIANLKLEPDL